MNLQRARTKYIVFQEEKGENGTHHLQGYVELTKTIRMRGLKILLGCSRLHIEPRRGTQQQAIAYCTKEESRVEGGHRFEQGKRAVQGERTDLAQLVDAVTNHPEYDDLELAATFGATYVRNWRCVAHLKACAAQRIAKQRMEAGKQPPQVIVLWGPPGTGKSKRALDLCRGTEYFYVQKGTGSSLWFTGCSPFVETIVFDDFYSWIPYDFLLRLCDRYIIEAQSKGGTIPLVNVKRIIFTSNQSWKEWYPKVREKDPTLSALGRRITESIHFALPYAYKSPTEDPVICTPRRDEVSEVVLHSDTVGGTPTGNRFFNWMQQSDSE